MTYDIRNHRKWTEQELKVKDPEHTDRWQSVSDAIAPTADKWDSRTQNLRHGVCYGDYMPSNVMIEELPGKKTRMNLIDTWNRCNRAPRLFDAGIWMGIVSAILQPNSPENNQNISDSTGFSGDALRLS